MALNFITWMLINIIYSNKEDSIIPEYIEEGNIKIKNFYANKNINWKASKLQRIEVA